jgi:hypothetical protein
MSAGPLSLAFARNPGKTGIGGGISTGTQVYRARSPLEFVTLGGVDSPGSIPKGGVKGFRRETGFDRVRGKGTAGATLIEVGAPPAEGTVLLQLFTDQDSNDYDNFCAFVLMTPRAVQKLQGLSLYYPTFSGIKLSRVVVGWHTPPEHQGKGLYHVTIQLIEWSPPPPLSVVKKVIGTKPDLPSGPVPDALDALFNAAAVTLGPGAALRSAQTASATALSRLVAANNPGPSK